jgi:tetratricopeptide (TPR) repeat protein
MMEDADLDLEAAGLWLERWSRRQAEPEGCPEAGMLAAYAEGRADPEVEAHLAVCPSCAADVEAARRSPPASDCPTLEDWLRLAAGLLDEERAAALRAHAAGCALCQPETRLGATEARALLVLLETQGHLRRLGVAAALSGALQALRQRRAQLPARARGRLHRARERHLGRAGARPATLVWTSLGREEDGYTVELAGERGQARVRVHGPFCRLDEDTWKALGIVPGKSYRWWVQPTRAGLPVGRRLAGEVWFLDPREAGELAEQEAGCRALALEEEGRALALGALYHDWGLDWEACRSFERYLARRPGDPLGPLLLGQACETMGRLQEAAEAYARASRLLGF